MKVYSLAINDEPVVEIEIDTPRWLPVRPVLNKRWLRSVVAEAMHRYFIRRTPVRTEELLVTARS